jgi:ATP-dependent protease ClpP protease subunit
MDDQHLPPLKSCCNTIDPDRGPPPSGGEAPKPQISTTTHRGQRHLHINGAITTESMRALCGRLNRILTDLINARTGVHQVCDVFIHISSPGGEPIAVDMVRGTLKRLKRSHKKVRVRFTTIAEGLVASAGVDLWLLGDDRIVMDGSVLIVHHSLSYCSSGDPDITMGASILDSSFDETSARRLAKCSRYTFEDWMTLFKSKMDHLFDPEQALFVGLATKHVKLFG